MAYSSPYLTSAPGISLYSQLLDKARKKRETSRATEAQKNKLLKQFEAQIKSAEARAKEKGDKFGGISNAIKALGYAFGPIGAAVSTAVTSLAKGERKKQAMKSLLREGDIAYKRFGKTFMKEGVEDIRKIMKKKQVSTSDIIKDTATDTLGAYVGAKAFDTGEIFKGLGQDQPMKQLWSNLQSSFDPSKIRERSVKPLSKIIGSGEGKFADWGGTEGIETILEGLKMFSGKGDIGDFYKSIEKSGKKDAIKEVIDLMKEKNKIEISDFDDWLRLYHGSKIE